MLRVIRDRAGPSCPILQTLEGYLRQHNALSLLAALPPPSDLAWRNQTIVEGALPKALVIGTLHGTEILACLIRNGTKPYEIRYFSHLTGAETFANVMADDIASLDLVTPFEYIKGSSNSEKRKMSLFIKFYFLVEGVIEERVGGDLRDFCKRFLGALQVIYDGQHEAGILPENEREDTEQYLDNDDAQAQEVPSVRAPDDADDNPPDEPAVDPTSDFNLLKQYLDLHDTLPLLENIPPVGEMTFKNQKLLDAAQPKKLYVGKHKTTGDSIWAYMRRARAYHEIKFFTERDNATPQHIKAELVATQDIIPPFNKTYSSYSNIDQGDKARLTLMVKWYFIAAGIVKNEVLKETKDYPLRFRSALEHIARKMNSTAARPAHSDKEGQGAREGTRYNEVNETHIQSTLGEETGFSDNVNTHEQQPTPDSAAERVPQRNKRSAEQVHRQDLQKILNKDAELTEIINGLDAELDDVEARLQSLRNKRRRLINDRKENADSFRRKSAQFGINEDVEEDIEEEM